MRFIQTMTPELSTFDPVRQRGEWTSHLPILPLGHIALDFASISSLDRHSYEAAFFAEFDDDEVRIGFDQVTHTNNGSILKPGLMRELQQQGRPTVELVAPDEVDGYKLTGFKRTGELVVHSLVDGEPQAIAGLTDNIDVAQVMSSAYGFAISSPRIGKFKSQAFIPVP